MSFFTENQIWQALNVELSIWESSFSATVEIKRKFQPTQQRVPPNFAAYLFQIYNKRFGFQGSSDVWSDSQQIMIHTERYIYKKHIQISTQKVTNPKDEITVGDVAESIAAHLGSQPVIERLKSQGIEIFRITDVRHPHYINDADRYEGDPTFDFAISYTQEIESEGIAVAGATGNVYNEDTLPTS